MGVEPCKLSKSWFGKKRTRGSVISRITRIEDLKEHLKDLYADLSAGLIPGARRVEDLLVS